MDARVDKWFGDDCSGEVDSAENLAETLNGYVQEAASCAIPSRNNVRVRAYSWWSNELSMLKNETNRLRKRYQRLRRNDLHGQETIKSKSRLHKGMECL